MSTNKFKPGDRVVVSVADEDSGELTKFVNEYKTYYVGSILDKKARNNHYYIAWDGGQTIFGNDELNASVLTLESEKHALQAKSEMLRKEIEDKIKQAAKLINEARKLAKKN